MKKAYVVMEVSWEYNDEIYYTTDDGAGQPERVFLDKKKAEEYAVEKTADTIRGAGHLISEKYYSLSDILRNVDEDEFKTMLEGMGGSIDDDGRDIKLPKNLSIDNVKKILAAISLRWYKVEETEIED